MKKVPAAAALANEEYAACKAGDPEALARRQKRREEREREVKEIAALIKPMQEILSRAPDEQRQRAIGYLAVTWILDGVIDLSDDSRYRLMIDRIDMGIAGRLVFGARGQAPKATGLPQ
jgi:hypothetical protein